MELLIKNIRACDPQTGLDGITDIGIDGGKIVSLGKTDEHAQRVIDAKGKLCALPGLFDMHVHFRDPGLTYKGGHHHRCERRKGWRFHGRRLYAEHKAAYRPLRA